MARRTSTSLLHHHRRPHNNNQHQQPQHRPPALASSVSSPTSSSSAAPVYRTSSASSLSSSSSSAASSPTSSPARRVASPTLSSSSSSTSSSCVIPLTTLTPTTTHAHSHQHHRHSHGHHQSSLTMSQQHQNQHALTITSDPAAHNTNTCAVLPITSSSSSIANNNANASPSSTSPLTAPSHTKHNLPLFFNQHHNHHNPHHVQYDCPAASGSTPPPHNHASSSSPGPGTFLPSSHALRAVLVLALACVFLVNLGMDHFPSHRLRSPSGFESRTRASFLSDTSSISSSSSSSSTTGRQTKQVDLPSQSQNLLTHQTPPQLSSSQQQQQLTDQQQQQQFDPQLLTSSFSSSAPSSFSGRPRIQGQVNIAFFLQISVATVPLLPRLLARLYHPNNVYAIHFDLKISSASASSAVASLFATHPEYKQNGNVIVMPSELITYRGISMLLNTIDAMRLLAHVDRSWEYFINLSGADYPLLDPMTIRKLLYANGQTGLNYFSFADRHTWASMAENRLSQLWFDEALSFRGPNDPGNNNSLETTARMAATDGTQQQPPGYNLTRLKHIRNPLIDKHRYEVAHAEAWMINSRTFCDFVLTGDVPRKLLVAFAFAVDASEHYFASLVWNVAEFKKTVVPHSMRKIVWSHNGVASGQHPYMIDDLEPYTGPIVNRSNDDGIGKRSMMNESMITLTNVTLSEQQQQQDRKQIQTSTNGNMNNNNNNNNAGSSVSFGKTLDDVVIVTKPMINTNNKKNNNNNIELGNYKYKFQKTLHQSALLFTRKFGDADSGLMDWIDARSRDDQVIAQATDHLLAKIETRQLRVSQL